VKNENGGEKLNTKMVLATLLLVLVATAIVVTVAVAFNRESSICGAATSVDEKRSHQTTFSGEVRLIGDPRDGGWPECNGDL